jgi:hypothetical protein
MLPTLPCIAALTVAARRLTLERVIPIHLFEEIVIRNAVTLWRRGALEDDEREEIIAAFGRNAGRALLGAGDRL